MERGLSLEQLPLYFHSSFRYFGPGEKHITRICPEDVLILMMDGKLSFKEDGEAVLLEAGEYYLQQSGLKQEAHLPSGDARYYYLHFKGVFSAVQGVLPVRGKADFSLLYPHIEKLERLQSISASKVELNAEFYAILSALRAQVSISPSRKTVLKVMSLIGRDPERIWTLDALAATCGYSKNNLIRIFKAETGKTPLVYITELRIGRAKVQLANSDLPLYEIARNCGFGSYINFYKCFRQAEGCSPEIWRQKHR